MTRAEEKAMEYADKALEYTDAGLAASGYRRHNKMKVINMCGYDVENAYLEGYEQATKDFGWHSIEEELPPYDKEVIALSDEFNGHKIPRANRICYAHRPNPEGWTGKDIATGTISHHTPITYNGWNTPGIKYWMYCPELEELK